MARNPYAGLGSADPYTNGNGYGAPSRSASTDDYGAPPGSSGSSSRARHGGYGGFYDDSNGAAAAAVQPAASRPSQDSVRPRPSQDSGRPRPSLDSSRGDFGYSGRSTPVEPAPPRSPRLPRMGESQSSTERRRRPDGSGDSGRMDYRRPERQYTNGSGGQGDMMAPGPRGAGSRSNIPGSGGDGTKQIEDVLQYIQSEWSFMAQDKCVPVQVALQLMDSSSVGRAHQYQQFRDTHQQLQRALKAIVNEYHQGFNSSIGTFHKIQSSIQSSQSRVRVLKESLGEAKVSLSTTRPELKGLAATSQSYEEMLHALGQIEQLRSVTDNLEARISEKRFLTAVDVLQDSLRMLRKPEMDNIGALSDLRIYLVNQETSLTDILIEELHSHLYLKSPYCQDRWKAHAKEQSSGVSSEGNDGAIPALQPLYQFLDDLDISKIMVEDASRNPEADSFYYIQLLVEALNKMGRLDVAVNSIEQRLPVELFRVVDKTNSEVDQRHPSSLRGNLNSSNGRLDHNLSDNDGRAIVMYDLLWTLYAKFEAIAEGHRVLHDVVTGILKRDGIRNSGLTGGFKELWKLYQNEMRSLLHDYLATDGNIYRSGQVTEDPSSVFRRNQRDKNKRLFRLSDMDAKSLEMATELDDLESILKISVPGLVSDRRPDGDAADENHQQTDGAATGHKLLIEPSVFNMGLLLPPSLSFLQRLKEIVPPDSDIIMSTLTSFLDDFLVNVFHPQLDETLVDLSSQIIVEVDAFQEDPQWSQIARRPVFRGSSAFFNLISTFCRMLDTIPHDQAFSQLIITQMVTYYDKCCDWFKLLVSRSQEKIRNGSSLKTSAALASGPGEIHDTLQKLWTAEEDEDKILLEKETGLLILQTNETAVHMVDILSDRKTISSLALLYTSMKWLASKIDQLRHITAHDTDSSRRNAIRGAHKRRWTLLNDPTRAGDGKGPVYLPMTQESVVAFDGIVSSFQELAGTVLLTLHTEIRIQIIHSLTLALSPTTAPYLLEQAVNDPDLTILTLNNDLVVYDDTATLYLPSREMSFLRKGLGHLISSLLVTNASSVGTMNANGCGRMLLNILVLQQNLKNIEPDTDLARARDYFDMFNDGADKIVQRARDEGEKFGYGYDELKVLIELCYSEQLASPERGISTVANRKMGESLLALSEYMWQT